MGLQIKRRSSIKLRIVSTVIAVAALVAQPLYGFVSYQIAHALPATTVAVTPNTLSIDGGYTKAAAADASNFTDLKLSFHYNANKLEAGEQLLYGWGAGQGTAASLGAIDGVTGNHEEGDVTDVSLPAGADISNLSLSFSNTGTDGASDNVTVNNISLTGTPSTPATPASIPNAVTLASRTTNSITLNFNITQDNAGGGLACFDVQADAATTLPDNEKSICLPVGWNNSITFSNVDSWIQVRENLLDGTNTAWQTFTVQPAVVKPVENARTHKMFDTLQTAIDDSDTAAGDTIDINQDISVPAQVNINKSVTINGQGHTVSVDGTGYRFLITAAGSTLQNMNVVKTDKVGEQNIVGIQANNVTIDSVNFTGQFTIGDGEVERALEVSGVSNVTVKNSKFEHLRQPAYVNTATGTFSNNYTNETKGWVLVANSNIHFTGNTWGTNVTDLAIIDDDNNPATPITDNYTCPVMAQIKADNNNASIDNQVMTGTCAAPVAPSNLQVKYQYDSKYIKSGSIVRTLSSSNPLELTWSDGASTGVTAHHILVTWPDGSQHISYQADNTNAWLSKNKYNNGDGFGQHGEGKYTFQVEAINANGATTSTETFSLYYVSHIPTATFAATPSRYVNGDFQVTIIGQDTTALQSVGADVRDPSDTTGNSYRTGCTNPTLLDGATLPAYSNNGSGVTVKVTCTIKTAGLINGHTYLLRARAGFSEANGQSYGNSNAGSTWQFTVDTTPPTVPTGLSWLDSNKKLSNNGFTNVQTGTLSWKDTDSSVDHYIYKFWTNIPGYFYGENNAWDTETTGNRGLIQQSSDGGSIWTNFANKEGTYSFCVEAVDAAGNVSKCSATYSVTYDATAPTVTIMTPTDNAAASTLVYVSNKNDITISGTATDSGAGVAGQTMTVAVTDTSVSPNKALLIKYTTVQADGSWSITLPAGTLPDNHHMTISAAVRDKAAPVYGNVGSDHAFFVTDNTAPAALTITPASGTDIKGDQIFTVKKSDSNDVLKVTTSAGTLVDNNDGTYTLDTTAMAKGTKVTITATETDEANNSTVTTATYTVENTAPTVSGITMGHSADGQYWLTGSSANSTDAQVAVQNNGLLFAGPVNVNADGSWTVPLGALPKSTSYDFTVVIANALGYSSSLTQTFTTAPLLTSFVKPSVTQSLLRSFATVATPVNTAPNPAPTVKNGSDKGILGAQTTKKGVNDTSVLSPSSQGWKILGFAWYWWLILIAAIVALWYWLAAVRRRRADEAAYLNK